LVSLRKVAPHLEVLSQAVDELGAVLSAVEESSVGLREAAAGVVYDADELDRTLSRLAALDGLKKRFGPTLDVVIDRRESLRATSEVVESGDEALSRARGEADRAERAYRDAAQALDSARSAVALRFGAAVLEEMRGLELGNVAFEVTLRPLDFGSWTGSGPSSVEFMYSPAAGVPTKPLVRIASGGEISRVMLALKSALGAGDPTDTLVFDEVDAGIGGATATAVGERLAALAQRRQVIVVTHLAQVAAYADTHYVVRKVESEDATFTAVIPVEGDDRTREVARMLSGETSAVALEHARVLLNDH
jgi:DNA repair protein RecN (Recombination protein N)